MSILGLMENTADIAQTTPDLSALPSTNTERFGAAWDAAQSPDRYWNVQAARKQGFDKIIDDLHAMTGVRHRNPADNSPTADEIRENLGQPTTVIYAKRLTALREATRKAKEGIEQFGGLPQDYLDIDSVDASIASESGGRRAVDERMSGTGGGFGAFVGGMAGETVSPHGILSSFIPVTRMGGAAAAATVRGFAMSVAREAAFQGTTQGLAQSLATIVDYQTRKEFGTEQTNAQILEEILGATVGGAVLGGAFRAAHLGILKLASRGVEVPPAVLDSARVMEEGDLYGNKNPLRINPGQNEVATDQAMGAAVMGRAASPDVEVGVPNLHEAARRLEPELMARYDAAVAWRDEARAILAPTDETIAMLKKRMDDADSAIANAGPQTGEAAERLGATARMARLIHDDAVERKAAMAAGQAPAAAPGAADPLALSPQHYESVGRVVDVQEIFTPAEIAPGKLGAKKAFIIDPQGRLIDVSDIGHPEANTRLNKLAGLGAEDEGGFHGGTSPVVRIDATNVRGEISLGVNAYKGGVTAAQKRMIDAIERRAARDARRGEKIIYFGEVSESYGGGPVSDLKDVKIKDRAAPAAAGPAETTVSQSMRQQAAQADLELRELIPEINKVMTRAGEEMTAATRAADAARAEPLSPEAGISEARLSPEEVSRVRELQEQIADYEQFRDKASPEDAPAWQQAIDEFNGEIAKIMDLDVPNQAPVQAALKAVAEHPSNPMQAPRTTPEVPPAAAPKAPGESAEDKTVLQQVKALLDSETQTPIDPNVRQAMEIADIQEREAKSAVACVVGAI